MLFCPVHESEFETQLHFYVSLRAGVYPLQSGGDMVAVKIVGDACLDGHGDLLGQADAGREGVTYAPAVERRIAEGIEQSVFVAIDTAVVVVGIKTGGRATQLKPTALVARLLAEKPSEAAVTAAVEGNGCECLEVKVATVESGRSLGTMHVIVFESAVPVVIMLTHFQAVTRLPAETAAAIIGRYQVVPYMRRKGHAIPGP